MVKPPCYQCTDRQLGCHVKCDKYITFRRNRGKELDALHADVAIRATIKRNLKHRCETRRKK